MDARAWDERYAASELVWSATPNQFVAAELADLDPGRALDLAAGEGRNALWLADRGWQVTAVDFSQVALDKGRALQARHEHGSDLQVDWVRADALTFEPGRGRSTWRCWPTSSSPRTSAATAVRRAFLSLRPGRHVPPGRPRLEQPDRGHRRAHRPLRAVHRRGGARRPGRRARSTWCAPAGSSAGCSTPVRRNRAHHHGEQTRTAFDALVRLVRRDPDPAPGVRVRGPAGIREGGCRRAAVSESAVSMHVGQLRKELDDRLFTRTASGLAFTPGGLRLASRAVEILGLQDRTVREVSQAGTGRRLLRIAASSLFAEHAAPGLIDLFAGRAADLDVELSVHPAAQFPALLAARTVDIAIGRAPSRSPDGLLLKPFLDYEVLAVARPDHPMAAAPWTCSRLREPELAARPVRGRRPRAWCRRCCASWASPSSSQRIFQSDAAALEETKRTQRHRARAAASRSRATWPPGGWPRSTDRGLRGPGPLGGARAAAAQPAAGRPPSCWASSPPRAPPRRWSAAPAWPVGRFKPSVHVTLWTVDEPAQAVDRRRGRRDRPGARSVWARAGSASQNGRAAAIEPDQRLEAGHAARAGSARSAGAPAAAAAAMHRGQLAPARRCPSRRRRSRALPRAARCRAGSGAGRPGSRPGACRRTGPRPCEAPPSRPPRDRRCAAPASAG